MIRMGTILGALVALIAGSSSVSAQIFPRPIYPNRRFPVQVQPQPTIIIQPGYRLGQKPKAPIVLPQIRQQPQVIQPGIVQPYYPSIQPQPVFRSTRSLERHVERCIERKFRAVVDDVDVDVDFDRRRGNRIEIDVELDDLRYARTISRFIYSMPELRGYRIDLEFDD